MQNSLHTLSADLKFWGLQTISSVPQELYEKYRNLIPQNL